MASNNDILEKIGNALQNEGTPQWAIPILLCIRDDHVLLREHLASHSAWITPARQIFVSVLTALAVALVIWIVAGRLPGVFGP